MELFKRILVWMGLDDSDNEQDDVREDPMEPERPEEHFHHAFRRRSRYACPHCEEPLEDITLPKCPYCGKSTARLFFPAQNFAEFKKYALDDPSYRLEARKTRRWEAGRIIIIIYLILYGALSGIMAIPSLIDFFRWHTTTDLIFGLIALSFGLASLYWAADLIHDCAKFNIKKTIYEAMKDEYYRALREETEENAYIYEEAMIQKLCPSSRVYHLLAACDTNGLSDGLKTVFLNMSDNLVVMEVWDPYRKGYEVIEIPNEKIFSVVKGSRSISGFSDPPFFMRRKIRRSIHETVTTLHYKDPKGNRASIDFLDRESSRVLRHLLPEKWIG